MGEPFPGTPPPERPPEDRLDSWKEIAAYLGRDVTTVQRWEKREAMPVHRHLHDRMGSVYAFSSELDAWVQSRRLRLEEEEKERLAEAPGDTEGDHRPSGIPRSVRWLMPGSVAVLTLLAGTYFMTRSRSDATRPKIRSLAVLPLRNLSGDPTQEFLADGMTEALIGRLSSIHDLRVISRTSVMRFKETGMSAPDIAKTLNVDALVEGSVMREGDRLRVHAQLIRAVTDEHFWSEEYDGEMRDVFALESKVAQSIARKVEVTVTGEERARLVAARDVSPEVYESYLKGRSALDRSNHRVSIDESISYFEQAIARDPTFAPAYVGLANAHFQLSTMFIGARPGTARGLAMNAAKKAVELDPESVEGHLILADLEQTQWHWAEAEADYRRALELNPSNAIAHDGLAQWLLTQGRAEESLTWAQRGRALDPLAVAGVEIGWILFHARRYDDALHELRSDVTVQAEDSNSLWILGIVLADNQPEEAITVLEKAASGSDRSPAVLGVLIRAYVRAGRRADALRLFGELKRRQQAGFVSADAFVNAYLGLGDNEQALAWLERSYQERSNILLFLKVHPHFDPLRGDPRFKDLLHRVGLDRAR